MAESPRSLLRTNPPELADELLKFIVNFCSAEKLLREHTPDKNGVCPACHWHGPCTLYQAATVVVFKLGGSKLDRRNHAYKRIIATIEEIEERPKVGRCTQVRLPRSRRQGHGRPCLTSVAQV